MKKLLLLTLILCLVLPCLGCDTPDTPPDDDSGTTDETVHDPYQDVPLVDYTCYVEDGPGGLWDDSDLVKDPNSKTVEIFDQQYTVDYKKTHSSIGYPYKLDDYECRYNNGSVWISFHEITGELKSFRITGDALKELEDASSERVLSKEEILLLAEEIASGYADDLSKYDRTIGESEEIIYSGGAATAYEVRYQRTFQGIPTIDFVSITITTHGNVYNLNIGDMGSFDTLSIDIDKKVIEKRVVDFIKKRPEHAGAVGAKLDIPKFGLAPDGKLCYVAGVFVCMEEYTKQGFLVSVVLE